MNYPNCRKVLDCARPLALWTKRRPLAKRWRDTAVQNAGALVATLCNSRS